MVKPNVQIFLSHAGEDHIVATRFAKRVEQSLSRLGKNIIIFNTSEPEHRFKDLKEVIVPGDNWAERAGGWDRELRQYLRQNIISSTAYLLFITERSLRKNSTWIEFEIEVANKIASHREIFFIPCITKGMRNSRLPGKSVFFQAVDVSSNAGLESLMRVLTLAIEG